MRKGTPSKRQIVDYWSDNQTWEEANECKMGADESEWLERCWCCGFEEPLERCHIIPHSLGGGNHPSNFVLLCNSCHNLAPNVNDKYYMWEWINENRNTFYFSKEEMEVIRSEVELQLKNTSIHFGHGKLNTSTREYIQRKVADKIVETYLK